MNLKKKSLKINFDTALQRIKNLCSKKEMCKHDIAEKLKYWGITEEQIIKIIQILEKNRFIDENRFIYAFVGDKMRLKKWGKHRIFCELQKKHIDEQSIAIVIDEISNEIDSKQIIKDIINKKIKLIKDSEPYKKKAKLIRYLSAKGYDLDTIHQIIEEMEIF